MNTQKLLNKLIMPVLVLTCSGTMAQFTPSSGSGNMTNDGTGYTNVGIGLNDPILRDLHIYDAFDWNSLSQEYTTEDISTAVRLETDIDNAPTIGTVNSSYDMMVDRYGFHIYDANENERRFSLSNEVGRAGINTVPANAVLEIKDNGVDKWTTNNWRSAITIPLGGAVITDAPTSEGEKYLGFGMSDNGFYFSVSDDAPGEQNNAAKYAFIIQRDGLAISRELLVSLTQGLGWPDYVFSPEYELPSLNEVSAYIAENGHLPDVPAAKKVKEEGIMVGEMNAILLKKIEELTLYILEQDKRISELETKSKQSKIKQQ